MVPYVRSLDKLRGVAVLLVLFIHTPNVLKPLWAMRFQAYADPGYLGVDLFFALSGFLITRILLEDRRRGAAMRGFWIRRAIRIFPACYLLLAVVWILRPGPELPWVAAYISNFYFLGDVPASPLAHTWSLAVEEHFYLVWPLLVLGLSSRRAQAVILLGLIPLALATGWYVATKDPAHQLEILGHITPARILTLALGSLLAFHEPALHRRPWTWALGGLVVGVLGYAWAYAGLTLPALRPLAGLHRLGGFALLSTAVVLLVIEADRLRMPRASAALGVPLALVGRISYGLYLYHLPVFFALDVQGHAARGTLGWPRMLLAIGLSFLAAGASYRFFERPLLRWGSRFRDLGRTPAA